MAPRRHIGGDATKGSQESLGLQADPPSEPAARSTALAPRRTAQVRIAPSRTRTGRPTQHANATPNPPAFAAGWPVGRLADGQTGSGISVRACRPSRRTSLFATGLGRRKLDPNPPLPAARARHAPPRDTGALLGPVGKKASVGRRIRRPSQPRRRRTSLPAAGARKHDSSSPPLATRARARTRTGIGTGRHHGTPVAMPHQAVKRASTGRRDHRLSPPPSQRTSLFTTGLGRRKLDSNPPRPPAARARERTWIRTGTETTRHHSTPV